MALISLDGSVSALLLLVLILEAFIFFGGGGGQDGVLHKELTHLPYGLIDNLYIFNYYILAQVYCEMVTTIKLITVIGLIFFVCIICRLLANFKFRI